MMMVDIGHFDGFNSAVTELVDLGADSDAAALVPGCFLDDKASNSATVSVIAIGNASEEGHHTGPFAISHPHFGAINYPLIAVALCSTTQGPGIGTAVRF